MLRSLVLVVTALTALAPAALAQGVDDAATVHAVLLRNVAGEAREVTVPGAVRAFVRPDASVVLVEVAAGERVGLTALAQAVGADVDEQTKAHGVWSVEVEGAPDLAKIDAALARLEARRVGDTPTPLVIANNAERERRDSVPDLAALRAAVGAGELALVGGRSRPISYMLVGHVTRPDVGRQGELASVIPGDRAPRQPRAGEFAFTLEDASGALLQRIPFGPEFNLPHGGPREIASFTERVPNLPGTARITLLDPSGAVLSSVDLTTPPPVVRLLEPSLGHLLSPADQRLRVRWEVTGSGDGPTRAFVFTCGHPDRPFWIDSNPSDGDTEKDLDLQHVDQHVPGSAGPRLILLRVVVQARGRFGETMGAFFLPPSGD